MKESQRLNAISSLISDKRAKRKSKIKAKIKAKVKLKVQKEVEKIRESCNLTLDKIKLLRSEVDGFNPRMTPLQPHTKTKWVQDIDTIISSFYIPFEPIKKE